MILILILCMLDFENREHTKFQSNWSISYRDINLISLSKFDLLLIGSFYVTHAARALQSHDLSGEGIKLWITDRLFDHTRTWRASPDEGLAQCRTTSETTRT